MYKLDSSRYWARICQLPAAKRPKYSRISRNCCNALWQRSLERRTGGGGPAARPVFQGPYVIICPRAARFRRQMLFDILVERQQNTTVPAVRAGWPLPLFQRSGWGTQRTTLCVIPLRVRDARNAERPGPTFPRGAWERGPADFSGPRRSL